MNRYAVLAAGAVMQLLLGILYVWSVLVVPVSEHFAWARTEAKLIPSVMFAFFVVGILFGGRFQRRVGTSLAVLCGGLCVAAGFFATAFLPMGCGRIIYATYGALGGLGVGMAYNAILTAAQAWFPERRGFAAGVSVSAFGFSTVLFAPLITVLIPRVGVPKMFLLLGLIFAVVSLALFRMIRLPKSQVTPTKTGQAKPISSAKCGELATGEMLRTKAFYFLTLSLGAPVFLVLVPSIKTLSVERGLLESTAIALVMSTGIASAAGRLVIPVLSDRFGREIMALIGILATGLSALVLCAATGTELIVAILAISFFYGGSSGIYPVLTSDYFGLKNFGANYGVVMIGFALAGLLIPWGLGFVASESAKFLILSGLSLAAATSLAVLWGTTRRPV